MGYGTKDGFSKFDNGTGAKKILRFGPKLSDPTRVLGFHVFKVK